MVYSLGGIAQRQTERGWGRPGLNPSAKTVHIAWIKKRERQTGADNDAVAGYVNFEEFMTWVYDNKKLPARQGSRVFFYIFFICQMVVFIAARPGGYKKNLAKLNSFHNNWYDGSTNLKGK
jgi:hypothetical protein